MFELPENSQAVMKGTVWLKLKIRVKKAAKSKLAAKKWLCWMVDKF